MMFYPFHHVAADTPPMDKELNGQSCSLYLMPSPIVEGFDHRILRVTRLHLRSYIVRPNELLTLLNKALSMGSTDSVSFHRAIQAARL